MRELLRNYISWAGSVYKTMVRASDDEVLRILERVGRGVEGSWAREGEREEEEEEEEEEGLLTNNE